MKNKKYKVIKI